MLFYKSTSQNPYFNIAAEEYFLKNFDEDFFYLYINELCIIVGKHQNTTAEINIPYAYKNNLKVVRRLSGGGTVFHDLGNLNYCFIQKGKEGFLVDFKKYTQPVLDTLQILGVNAKLKGKSDLVIDNLKFSGNAEHIYRNKVLHHGTLLFSSELNKLNEAIKADWSKFKDKAVRSNRSKVTNIVDHLASNITLESFAELVVKQVFENNLELKEYTLNSADIASINQLIKDKYNTWKWNFGYSPKYNFSQKTNTPAGELSVSLSVEKGEITTIILLLNNEKEESLKELAKMLIGKMHEFNGINKTVNTFCKSHNIFTNPEMLIKLLF